MSSGKEVTGCEERVKEKKSLAGDRTTLSRVKAQHSGCSCRVERTDEVRNFKEAIPLLRKSGCVF
jgi:hypothetical protein